MPGLLGWTGRILTVDLGVGRMGELRPGPSVYADFLGGRGLGAYLLRQAGVLAADDPALPLILATGPLTGFDAPATSRCRFVTRSPLTGALMDAGAGGSLGPELKRAGFDALFITGKAGAPTGLEICDGKASLTDATGLTGLSVPDVFGKLRQRHHSGAIAATGPAAEAGCLFASLAVNLHHGAWRGGLGRAAAMKNLKYISVRGATPPRPTDPSALVGASEDILRLLNASPAVMGRHGLAHYGTASLYDLLHARRMMPTDNFRRTRFEAAGELGAHAWGQRYHPLRRGCEGCPVRCKALAGDGRPMPELDAASHFTALIGNGMMELAMRANDMCACLGMDPLAAASVLACHMEATGEEPGPDRVLALIGGMAGLGPERELGARLGLGSARYAASLGRTELSMSVKGLDLPAFDPRGAYGMALSFATAGRGACQHSACAQHHEILRKPVPTDRFSLAGKARIVKASEDTLAAADSLTICPQVLVAAGLEEYARAYAAVTGLDATGADLQQAGERIVTLERQLNAAYGFGPEHDDLPARFFEEPGTGSAEIPVPPLPREEFLAALAAWRRIRGYDGQGLPLPRTLARLDLQGLVTGARP